MQNWVRLAALLLLCGGGARAVDWKALKPQGYVSDFAGVIDDQSKRQLDRKSTRLNSSHRL